MSDSVRPHRRQPTRLPRPWDSPGKSTVVGCLLQCMKVKRESELAQSCPTPSYPMDCSHPGSSVYGIFQARVLEWVAISFLQIFPTQGLNPGLPHCRWMLYPLSHQGGSGKMLLNDWPADPDLCKHDYGCLKSFNYL